MKKQPWFGATWHWLSTLQIYATDVILVLPKGSVCLQKIHGNRSSLCQIISKNAKNYATFIFCVTHTVLQYNVHTHREYTMDTRKLDWHSTIGIGKDEGVANQKLFGEKSSIF
jgi:hypothetical protein